MVRNNGGSGYVMVVSVLVGAGREVGRVFEPAVDAVRRRQWHRFALGPAATLAVIALSLAFRTKAGHAFINAYAVTRPADDLMTSAIKLPLSMFAPAALLPFWFAMLQVGVVYALAQALLGWRTTLIVAVAGHTLATLSSSMWIAIGLPFGVAERFWHFGDAGPSVAVVALVAYIAVARRVSWLAVTLIAYHLVEMATFNGLSQREHMVGAVVGATGAAAARFWRARGLGEFEAPRDRVEPQLTDTLSRSGA
jgi:hypothetical protein